MKVSKFRTCAVFVMALFLMPGLVAGDEKKEEKWDIDHFSDQSSEFELDVDEGTWLNVDVSPDGKSIVFDLLGDIYLMPFGGGEAKALTQGLAWDMQPSFSPDGKTIAFTSDRGGGDNIWTMDTKGENKQQVSKESFRLLNSPAWSPDGQYIAARKHFTSSRSLGAGEIWLFHKSGGGGLQLIEKPNKQKDLGEPAFSPDGRYVYFSQDTTPGGSFEYNKDPNPGIYSIKRIDRETGDVDMVLSGPGGAIRPTPSPDGKYLAFVRRHEYKTKLWLHDLESGENTIIYHDLDRDMQETWAIHGVYSTMAWTPDGKGLVFWAGGKINHVDVASRQSKVIPFHVKTKHTMVKALRHPVEVAPDKIEAKMLRWVRVSPDGKQVIYSALGHLYSKKLPDGKPRRLTDQNDHFEFYPNFSRDGKWITYISWNDDALAAVRIIPASGGKSRVVTTKTGQYTEPAFSPDGSKIVYSKFAGGYLTSPLHSNETGIYITSADGKGEPVRISKRGYGPHFADRDDRVFFTTVDEEMARTLRSVDTSGHDEREHTSSAMGNEMVVSPDGKWLAFSEHYNAHIMPFTWSSKKYTISPKSTDLPVRQVSSDAGEYLHWNGASNKLYWSLGNQLFERDLKDAFSFVAGAPEELPEPGGKGTYIGFEFDHDVPKGSVAVKGARIITMKGDEVIENGTIVIEGNRIRAIGPADEVKIPEKAYVVDGAGKTVIPGIVDVHAHAGYGVQEIVPQQNWNSHANMALGVTTTHNPSTDTSTAFATTEMVMAGLVDGPRTFSTGTILYGATMPLYTAKVDSLDDARSHLRRLKAVGAFSVKSYNQPRRDQRQQFIEGARQENMMVVPEGGSLYQHNMSMIADGHTGIEHSIPMAVLYDDVVQFWSHSETGYTPTLGVAYGGIGGDNYWYHKTEVWKHPLLSLHVPPYVLESRARRRTMAPEEEYNHIRVAEGCKKLLDAGVSVQLGAHGQREGLAAHWEMWMFAQGGMTPMEALRCGTLNGAKYLGLDGDIGSLEQGKLADLVILDANPLENIRNSDKVRQVMVNGRLFDAATMDQVGNHPKSRLPYFWEKDGASTPTTAAASAASASSRCRH